jgi:hypothetical protein
MMRTIHNPGDPFIGPDGQPMSGATMTWSLLDADGKHDPVSADDESTRWGAVQVVLDDDGEFSVSLWANDAGSSYLVTLSSDPGNNRWSVVIPNDDDTPLAWQDLIA